MSNIVKNPPFLFTYWNPFVKDSDLVENWFSYVKDTSIAKYTADTVGHYMRQVSADQIDAIDFTGRKICGALYEGFAEVQDQLSRVSGQLNDISSVLQSVNQRLDLVLDEARTSNLLLENMAELLRIPDSQKQRQHHIEMGLKFLKNARKDEDLYQDALRELLEAEKLMPSDYFVLHRIGMIYLYVPALGNLDKALDYFIKAGKYAFVESQPDAARLSNVLNKKVGKRFKEQAELSVGEINSLAAESYFEAGTTLYALGRFEEAIKLAEKASKCQPREAKHCFFLAKYLIRLGNSDLAVPQLQKAIELSPEMAIAALGDFDLNRAQPVLNLLVQLNHEVDIKLQRGIEIFKQWPERDSRHEEIQKWIADAQTALMEGNFFEKRSLDAIVKEYEKALQIAIKLGELQAFGISFDEERAELCLQIYYGYRKFPSIESVLKWGENNCERAGGSLKPRIKTMAQKPASDKTIEERILLAAFRHNVVWEIEIGGELFSGAAVGYNGMVYVVGLKRKMIYAFDCNTGEKCWESALRGVSVLPTYPVIGADGMVYIGSCDNKLYAFNGQTGKSLWDFVASGDAKSPPAIGADGTVYIGSSDHKLYALDGLTGRILWEYVTGGEITSSPAIGADGTVYIGSCDNKLYAINGQTGIKLWEFATGGEIKSSPAIGTDGTVYIGSCDNKIYAITGQNGERLWDFKTDSAVKFSPVIGFYGTVYLVTSDNKLYALAAASGDKVLWGIYDKKESLRHAKERAIRDDIEDNQGVGSEAILKYYSGLEITGDCGILIEFNATWGDGVYVDFGRAGFCIYDCLSGKEDLFRLNLLSGIKHTGCGQPVIGPDGVKYYHAFGPKFLAKGNNQNTCDQPIGRAWPMFGQNAQRTCCATKPSFVTSSSESKPPILPSDIQEEIAWYLAAAKAAEAAENAKSFRKKDFTGARELYSKAAALGSKEAVEKIKTLTK